VDDLWLGWVEFGSEKRELEEEWVARAVAVRPRRRVSGMCILFGGVVVYFSRLPSVVVSL